MTRALELPRVTAPVLWTHGYWDGPLSGIVMYEDRLCWFETSDDSGLPKRRFFLYDLEDWEIAEIVTRHLLFEMYVGTHHCHHSGVGEVKPRDNYMYFYDKYKDNPLKVTEGKRPFARFIMGKR